MLVPRILSVTNKFPFSGSDISNVFGSGIRYVKNDRENTFVLKDLIPVTLKLQQTFPMFEN